MDTIIDLSILPIELVNIIIEYYSSTVEDLANVYLLSKEINKYIDVSMILHRIYLSRINTISEIPCIAQIYIKGKNTITKIPFIDKLREITIKGKNTITKIPIITFFIYSNR